MRGKEVREEALHVLHLLESVCVCMPISRCVKVCICVWAKVCVYVCVCVCVCV
jgi:hypothetical protein